MLTQYGYGIMRFGCGQLSLIGQLVNKGDISDPFSQWYGGMDIGGGGMVLGVLPSLTDMVFSCSDRVHKFDIKSSASKMALLVNCFQDSCY